MLTRLRALKTHFRSAAEMESGEGRIGAIASGERHRVGVVTEQKLRGVARSDRTPEQL